jgi:hypothetical protein
MTEVRGARASVQLMTADVKAVIWTADSYDAPARSRAVGRRSKRARQPSLPSCLSTAIRTSRLAKPETLYEKPTGWVPSGAIASRLPL